MSYLLGLTGSIGMGKSTTAQMFAELGCDVWDADAAVHRLYSPNGAAVAPISKLFPRAIENNSVSRELLKKVIEKNEAALGQIERIVHPLVAHDRANFMKNATADILIFDVPLLFEGGGNVMMDSVVCVTVSPKIQEKRTMDRGTMTKNQYEMIVSKQMPTEKKISLSDFVVVTDSIEHAQQQVEEIVLKIRKQIANA